MSTTGALTRWFRDQFGHREVDEEADGGPSAYAALAKMAEGVPAGSQGLVCLPYFSGERTPINDPMARGMYAGLTLSHTRAYMFRASLEGTAYGVKDNLEVMAEMGGEPRDNLRPEAATTFFEEKYKGPDGVMIDIANHGWAGARPPSEAE